MKQTLRVGVVGVGSMGANHVRVYANRDDLDLIGIIEPNQELGDKVATRFNTKLHLDLDIFLAEENVDLVSIAVPTRFHKEVVEKCLRAGINCLVEKPIAANLQEAEFLSSLSEKLGLKLLVGHIERYNPAIQSLSERMQVGEVGTVYRIEVERSGPFPARITDTGVSVDLAVHDLDIVSMLLGETPLSVYSETQQLLHKKHEEGTKNGKNKTFL